MLRGLLITSVVVLGLTACGDDAAADISTDDARADDPGLASVTLAVDQPPSDEEVESATSVIERRLEELGVTGAAIERSGDELSVAYQPTEAVGPETVADVLGARGEVTFRPVLSSVPTHVASACDDALTPELDDSGQVMTAPMIQQPAFDETGVSITGQVTGDDAHDLAVVLRSDALPVALTPQGIEAPR